MEGWIKLHRKLLVSDMYQALDTGQRDVLITCLLLANHEAKEWEWNETIFKVNPGQFITSLASLRKHCASDVSIQNIRTALLKLEKWQFLTNKSTKTGRLITILNWDTYQNINYEANKDTGKELTKNQQLTRMINNDKEFIYADFEDFLEIPCDNRNLKTDKEAARKKWKNLTKEEQKKAVESIKLYYNNLPDKQYCKKARTYLDAKNFNDEINVHKPGSVNLKKLNEERRYG